MRPNILIPMKRFALAKTRLGLTPPAREHIARMLAARTLRVSASCVGPDKVFLVTAEPTARLVAEGIGASLIHDPHFDLNSAVRHGWRQVREEDPASPILVLMADLPILQPAELQEVLEAAGTAPYPCHVPDAQGNGTTAISAPAGVNLPLHFGKGSASRFRAAGCHSLDAPFGMRADLDTPRDLMHLLHGLPAPLGTVGSSVL